MLRLTLLSLALATTAALVTGPSLQAGDRTVPPSAWAQTDPADSLYRAAREALNRGNYQRSAELFGRIRQTYPKSAYAADACYWEAFARYRLGGSDHLRHALAILDLQAKKYPKAATRSDATVLATRIQGELARRGDASAAAAVTAQAEAAALATVAPGPPTAPAIARTPRTPTAPAVAPVALARAEAAAQLSNAIARSVSNDECEDDEDDARVAALNAVLQMDQERAEPLLQKVLARRDSGSVCLRRKAVFIVSQKRTPRTESILLGSARNDPDEEVREQAVFWLSQVGSEAAVTALDSILQKSPTPQLQEKAIFALSQMDTPRARQIIRSYAMRNDAPAEVQEQAIFWIGQRPSPENAAFLRDLYGKVRSEEAKEKVIFAIAQMKDPGNTRWLLDQAVDQATSLEVRKQALFWAGQSGASVADLATIYTRATDPEMKEQLLFTYSQSRDKAAVDKLIEIAKTEKDARLRSKAIFWLGQSSDPRAAKVLQDVLDQ
jgi:HEAT repeat protein